MRTRIALSIPVLAASLLSSCGNRGIGSYHMDAVIFEPGGPMSPAKGPVPSISINTNINTPGPFGGTMKSKKPYSVDINYTDLKFTYAAAEFTKVAVTYPDGTQDPGASALELPLRMDARHHVAINSGGPPPKYTFETPMRLITGQMSGVISRDEAFTILIEGRLIKDNGGTIPFTIRAGYKPVREKASQSWLEVVESI
jgi:hypothetical protein